MQRDKIWTTLGWSFCGNGAIRLGRGLHGGDSRSAPVSQSVTDAFNGLAASTGSMNRQHRRLAKRRPQFQRLGGYAGGKNTTHSGPLQRRDQAQRRA